MSNQSTESKKPPLTKAQKRRLRCRNCSFSLGLWSLFGLAVAKIIMGAEFGCSLDNKLIVYLVVSGGAILLITVLFIALIIAFGADVMFSKKMKKMMRVPIIVCLIHLPWLIVGSVWGFRNLKDVLDGCSGDCCNTVLVFFAVSTLAVDWILTILTIVSIHYLDISRKKIVSLFFDPPPEFVDVAIQHNSDQIEEPSVNKEKPVFEEPTYNVPAQDEVRIVTSKRGTVSVHENLGNDVTTTPVETFPKTFQREPSLETPVHTAVSFKPSTQSVLDTLPNIAEPLNQYTCDLLPTAEDLKASANKPTASSDTKPSGNKKGKGKTKKSKTT